MLQIQDLTYRVQGQVLLDGAAASVSKGERVGLVGRNGSGKTTLLRLICGELETDDGAISLPKGLRVGKVAQEAPGGETSLIETVLAADRERTSMLTAAERARDPARIAEIHERLVTIRADSAPARAARVLAGLGFSESAQQRPCGSFSGGWRMRVALAALLFSEPDLLLLDEPTNHLDLEASIWLESYLKAYPGTIVLVSHDRGLLNRMANKIVHLEAGKLVTYSGNFDVFERQRREKLALQAATRVKQEAERRHIQAFVDRFRYKASKARQAQSRIKALERMQPIAAVTEARAVTFALPDPGKLAPPILRLEGAAVGYASDEPVLRQLDLRLDMDDRIALLGPNGNGKTTLMRLLAGRLEPSAGEVARASRLRVGYFAQDQADELDLAASPLQHLARLLPDANQRQLRARLGAFGFGVERADVAAGNLSGGEKARLLFALVTWDKPHMLLLDEPTNHLDIDTRQALVEAIGAFEGAVVIVSHDSDLLQLVADRLWLVADGTVKPFEGDLDDYRQGLLATRREGPDGPAQERPRPAGALRSKKEKRQAAAAALCI